MLSVRQNNDAIRNNFKLTLLPAEQQDNHGSIVGSVEDLLYSAPIRTGAHHHYIQCCANWERRKNLLWGQGGRGATLATHIDLTPDLHNVVTRMTGLLFTSERSHYFRKTYLEERGLTSTKSYADRLTKIHPKIP